MGTKAKWDSTRIERFQKALVDAFPNRFSLEQLVAYGLDKNLDELSAGTGLEATAFELLKWARTHGQLDVLLEQACRRNPENPALRAFLEERAPFLVPVRPDTTVIGREEVLSRLHRALTSGADDDARAALVGMGGVGKTQLALEYAHRFRGDYPGGVYWVSAASPLVTELANLAERLGLGEDADPEEERAGRRIRAFERHLRDNPRALVIFDNIVDPLALRKAAAGIVPWDLPCRLLVTTQRQDPSVGFEMIQLDVLSEDAAVRLLLSSDARRGVLEGGRAAERDAARAICRLLGHLPLAIALAAAFLGKSPDLLLSDYAQRLRREGALETADATKRRYPVRTELQHEATVAATLRAQWTAIGGPLPLQVLKAAALLQRAAHVPRATLAHLTGLSDKPKDGYPAPLEEALSELFEWSLAEDATRPEAPRYKAIRLHPLVRDFALAQIEDKVAFARMCARRLRTSLGDVGRIEEEARARGLDAVLGDLRLGEALTAPEERERFRRLLRPLDRVAHCLRRCTPEHGAGFFLQQVRNTSFELGIDELRAQAETVLQGRGEMWLRERLRTSRESDGLVRTLPGHTSSVWSVAVLPDGLSALSASHDGTLKQWDLSSGAELRTLAGHQEPVNAVAVTPDGRLAVSASEDAKLKVWDLATGLERCTLEDHRAAVTGVAVTPDGRFAVSASADSTLNVWDLAKGKKVLPLLGHTEIVNSVAVTSDGRFAVSASEDCTLKVWNLATSKVIHTLEGHMEGVLDVAVTPDGRFAVSASADHTLKVWDLLLGQEVRRLVGHKSWVNGVAVTPDGRFAVSTSSDHTLKLWELCSEEAVHTLEGHAEPVKAVAVTPDGRLAISTSHDRTLKVWDLSSGRRVQAHNGHTSDVPGIAVTPDGCRAITASWDRVLKVWDLSTCAETRTLEGHSASVLRVTVTPDGRSAISASEDTTLSVWDLTTGERRLLRGHTFGTTGIAVTPDGRCVISASRDRTLKIWELASVRELKTLAGHTAGVNAVAVTPDGRWIVSASEDCSIKVWSLSRGEELFELLGHALSVTALAVTPDGHRLLSASEDMTIKVWDLETRREIATLPGHTAIVHGVAVRLDGRLAISTSEDATLRVWDLREARCLAMLEAHTPLLGCAIAPDGRTFLAGDSAGGLHVLDWIHPADDQRHALDAPIVEPPSVEDARPPRGLSAPAPPPVEPPKADLGHREAVNKSSIRGDSGKRIKDAPGSSSRSRQRRELTSSNVRARLEKNLISDSDLNAFCIDHFRDVKKRFADGMDRVAKINLLLEHVPLPEIADALKDFGSRRRR